jgi:hypothetical protein
MLRIGKRCVETSVSATLSEKHAAMATRPIATNSTDDEEIASLHRPTVGNASARERGDKICLNRPFGKFGNMAARAIFDRAAHPACCHCVVHDIRR